MPHDTEKITN